ncbi:regulator of microtubule dynamics protein 1-like [Lytechinus pictus]|uniref:regulator of microtubule dynamics protein 1-like n=1 Tax=Lytechinus pictus TaxID=7653 RepID=UPI0030B9BFE7
MLKNLMTWKEFGLGLLIGASGTIVVTHLVNNIWASDVQRLAEATKELQRECRELRAALRASSDETDGEVRRRGGRPRTPGDTRPRSRGGGMKRVGSEIISLHPSTSDEDEDLDFEEAYEGFTTPEYPLLYKDAPEQRFQSIATSSEELKEFLVEIDKLFDGSQSDHQEALRRMLAKESQYSSESEFLWRLTRAKVLVSEVCRIEGNDEERKRLVFEGREHAKRAIDLNDESSDSHKYYAITQGIITDWVSFSEAASLGNEYKQHIERALELRPEEPYLNHLYGRFLFSIANLGWMQRKAAVMMYGLSQSLSLDDALAWFEKAEELQPSFSNLNPFYSAKCYIAKGQTDVAVEFLRKAISDPGKSFEEHEVRQEAKELLQKYE